MKTVKQRYTKKYNNKQRKETEIKPIPEHCEVCLNKPKRACKIFTEFQGPDCSAFISSPKELRKREEQIKIYSANYQRPA